MPRNPPSTLPRQVGGFHLVRELGRGGMGVVYEAQEIDSGRVVALKVLAAELSVSGEAFERFRREARLAASISDVHCVFVYGAHQIEESPAIAMELVGGDTLQERITRGGSIPIETAVMWILDVIDGLEAAHRAGVIHRDVKPSNCFVGADGRVKIGDFGLSRTLERDIQLTQSGQFLGSPLYASPEQIRGRTVDARSDQYSCAATLYALLTGRAPFGGSNVGEVLARILSEHATPMRSIRIDAPSELERVVRRAMERDPEKRFRDLEAFRLALLPFSNRTAAAAPVPLRLTAWILDAILYGSIAATLSTMIQTGAGGPVDPERRWILVPLALQMAVASLPVVYFALSEALFAKSIGKWLVGIRIVSVGKGPPLWVRAILRACLYEAMYLLLLVPHHLLPMSANAYAILSLLLPLGTFAFRVSTMRKRNGWRGPHELWTGTRVVQSVLPFRSWRRKASPPENHVALGSDLPTQLGEYRVLGLVGTTHSGILLHGRDERLERSVWIQFRSSGAVAGESRRALNRSNRLRWLESVRSTESIADIFESPGGCGVADWGRREEPLDWPAAERVLIDLVDELARSQADALWPETWSVNQVWIDRNWNARLLDEPIPDEPATLTPVHLVGEVATALLGVGPRRELPPDLPVHAEPLVRALTGSAPAFADLAALREALTRTSGASTNVERRIRSAQIAVSTALLAMTAAAGMGFLVLVNELVPKAVELRGLLRELQAGHVATSTVELTGKSVSVTLTPRSSRIDAEEPEADSSASQMPSGAELDEESRTWRETVLAYESVRGLVASTVTTLPEGEQDLVYAAQAAIPDPDSATVDAARAHILEQRGPEVSLPERTLLPFTIAQSGALMVASTTALWTAFALLSTLIWPGGLTFRHFGLSIRRRRGRRGSRLFGFLRVVLFAIPLTLAYGAAFGLLAFGSAPSGWTLFGVVAALHVAGVVASIVDPTRGPIDRLLRSRIVPR